MAERRTEALLRRVRLRQEALGPSLSTWSLSVSLSASLLHRSRVLSFPRVIPMSSASFFRFASLLILQPFTHSVRVSREAYRNEGHLAFGHRYGTRANGSGSWTFREAQHCFSRPLSFPGILHARCPSFHRFSRAAFIP